MKKRWLSLLLLFCLLASLPTGCRQPAAEQVPTNAETTAAPTETEIPKATEAPPTPTETEIPQATEAPRQGYRFADHAEAADLLLSERRYYENLSQNDLNYRLQKTDATLPELEAFTREQTRDFTDAEKAAIDEAMQAIFAASAERGYRLPPLEDVIICKTTMLEECGAGAYTHGTKIFLGEYFMEYALSEDPGIQAYFRMILAHELFHCLTRNNPDFRADMYRILGFTVVDEDYVFSPEIQAVIISNPDVGHHNSYAAFEIDGVLRDCVVVFIADPFEKPGDSFFNSMQTGLVPIDETDVMYSSEDAKNFWDVFGRNTEYVIDPEETLADNFGMLIVYGADAGYTTPELIKAIDAYLKTR